MLGYRFTAFHKTLQAAVQAVILTHLKTGYRKSFYLLLLLALFESNALGIDFKIDLPPDMGVRETASKQVTQNGADFPDDLGIETFSSHSEANNDTKDAPTDSEMRHENSTSNNVQELKTAPFVQHSLKGNDASFPTPRCLAERVKFWESIYRDVDVDTIVLHDREDLSRIYGVARMASSAVARSSAADVYRNYYSNKLRELASLYDRPAEWDSTHRDLARHFPGKLLVPDVLLRASKNIRIQSGLKKHFENGIQRSLSIIGTVHNVVSSQGIPEDIIILPHVESGYNTRAVSKVGAVGLWQIMPDTMRLLMGRGSASRRTEVYSSTVAAAKLLRQNYAQTKSWPLALTAYNHGLNGVMKAVRQTSSHDLCTIIEKYESPSFRFASSNFYAQFLAARNVALPRYAEIIKKGTGPRILKPLLARRLGTGF